MEKKIKNNNWRFSCNIIISFRVLIIETDFISNRLEFQSLRTLYSNFKKKYFTHFTQPFHQQIKMANIQGLVKIIYYYQTAPKTRRLKKKLRNGDSFRKAIKKNWIVEVTEKGRGTMLYHRSKLLLFNECRDIMRERFSLF